MRDPVTTQRSMHQYVVAGAMALVAAACGSPRPAEQADKSPPGPIDPSIPSNATTLCAPPPAEQTAISGRRFFRYTTISGAAISWLDAKADCEAMGGKLAVPRGDGDDEVLRGFARGRDLFLGVRQDPRQPEPGAGWRTVEGAPLAHRPWAEGEPNDFDGREDDQQNCAMMFGGDGRWYDTRCREPVAADWACEFDEARRLCGPGATCEIAAGDDTYSCRCPAGRAYDAGANRCADVAACAADDKHGEAALCRAWEINVSRHSPHLAGPLLTGVQAAEVKAGDGGPYIEVHTAGIPDYRRTLTQADIERLNQERAGDFRTTTGRTTAAAGQAIAFGQDIGFRTTACALGYWPAGSPCPTDAKLVARFPLAPTPATTPCPADGTIGIWRSGALVPGWSSGRVWNAIWQEVAVATERLDRDICGGHASPNGRYHHRGFSPCLRDALGDRGDRHSPIHGFAADGYAIHGPYHAAGTLARSCWRARDYDTPGSPTGCAVAGERGCVLADPHDAGKGTIAVTRAGPSTKTTITTATGRKVTAISGTYFEDWYFDAACAAKGGEHLDRHNGHAHDDIGYHYHVTVEDDGAGGLVDRFPGSAGPTLRGRVLSQPAGGLASCE